MPILNLRLLFSLVLVLILAHSIDAENDLASETELVGAETPEKKVLVLPEKWPIWWMVIRILLYVGQGFSSVCAVIFVAAILMNPKVRSVSYNVYLVLLVIPDFFLNFSLMIIAILKVEEDGTFGAQWTHAIIFFTVFYYIANFWLNGIIAHQMYYLVKKSYRRVKVSPPSTKTVYMQGTVIYILSGLISLWCALQVPWSPMSSSSEDNGKFVFRSPDGGVFTKIGTYIFMATIIVGPTVYVLYVAMMMRCKKLLPKSGRTRVISLYFFRILFVFFALYYPNMIAAIVKSTVVKPNLWFILLCVNKGIEIIQALSTMYIAKQKTDISNAIDETLSKIWSFFRGLTNSFKSKSSAEPSQGQIESSQGNGAEEATKEPGKVEPKPKEDKWEEEDVYEYRRKTESILGEQVENAVWDEVEQAKISGGNKNVKDAEKEEAGFIPENVGEGRNKSLFSNLKGPKTLTFSNFESSEFSQDNRSSTTSEIKKRSQVSMDSYDSDFRRLNDGLKRLDLEAEEIMDYLKDSKAENEQGGADEEYSV